jgi:pimeloyl-ACP methyl ester carboxylesterase
MRKVTANGINFHYQQHGVGTDVILVHGVTSNLSYWLLTVVPDLAERLRVTVYDLRGHGFSDVPPSGYTTGDLAEDLRGLMDSLGIEQAHLVGHSFGGAIALHCAARYPERVLSLVLAETALPALRERMPIARWPGWDKLRERMSPYGVKLSDDPDSWDLNELLPELPKLPTVVGLRRGLPHQDRRLQRLATSTTCFVDLRAVGDLTEERIRTVARPTLAIYDDGSPFLPIGQYLEDTMPECRLLVQEGTHYFPAVAPQELARPLLAHFAAVERGSTVAPHHAGGQDP